MKFKMNNREWEIKEVEQSVFWEDDNDLENMNNKEHYFGRTKFDMQIIWIDKDIPVDLKKKTLYHELLHCYRGCYVGFCELNQCDEDFWCDLSANSHDIIHEIVEEYFKELEIEDFSSKYSCKSNAQILNEMADTIKMQQEWDKINPAKKAVGA